ncbi:MAG: hypothetical protein Fur0043_03400 [Anaerolineales bacterium]
MKLSPAEKPPMPWIETQQIPRVSPGKTEYTWQAIFACQIGIRPYQEREQLKWGFNAAVLLEEALDRQKLFLEAQLHNNPIEDPADQRTLALRCVHVPEGGLLLSIIGKVSAESQDQAQDSALNYLREVEAIFPYDYTIRPMTSQAAFERLTGQKILENCTHPKAMACIRRFESPLLTSKGPCRVVGLWQTGKRSDEQIWRALAHYPHRILLNISLSPTVLFEAERQALLNIQTAFKTPAPASSEEPYLQHYEKWIDPFLNRFILPWNKFFYLQVHVASTAPIDEHLLRSIGSAITRDTTEQSLPGFQVLRPADSHESAEWSRHIAALDIIHANKPFLLPRLSELASLEEAHAVFRFPYPLEPGWADSIFLEE